MGVVRTDGGETAIARWTDRLIKERIKKETGEGKNSGTLAMYALYDAFKAINRVKELMVEAGYMWPGDVEKIEDEEPEEEEEEEEHGEDNKEESHEGEDQHEGIEQEEEEEQVEEAKEIDVEGQQEDGGEQEEEGEKVEKADEEEQEKDEGGYDTPMVGLIEGSVGEKECTTPSPIVVVPSHSAPIQPKDGKGFHCMPNT